MMVRILEGTGGMEQLRPAAGFAAFLPCRTRLWMESLRRKLCAASRMLSPVLVPERGSCLESMDPVCPSVRLRQILTVGAVNSMRFVPAELPQAGSSGMLHRQGCIVDS